MILIGLGIASYQGWQIVDAIFQAERSVVVPLPTRGSGVALGGASQSSNMRPEIVPVSEDELTSTAETAATLNPDVLTPHPPTPSMPNVTVEPTLPALTTISSSPTSTAEPTAAATESPGVVSTATIEPTPVPTSEATSPQIEVAAEATATNTPAATEEPTIEPSATIQPTVEPTIEPTATAEPTIDPTATSPSLDIADADDAASDDAGQEDDGPSRIDVLQQVISAGLYDGEPGLSEVWNGAGTLNILVVGVDRRPDGGDQNSDVIIIAQVDLINKTMRAVSIPRDLLVEVPGIGYDKINSAYNHGVVADPENPAAGIAKLRDTIEYNFGIPIDHYVMIDFDGFVDVIDSVGGIDVEVPEDLYDPEYPTIDYGTEEIFFPAGINHMDGETALKYVRTRHQDSDDGRRERQLDVILAIFEKGKSFGSINNIDDLIFALGDSAQTSFELDEQLLLARLALQMDEANITMQSLAPPLIWSGTIAETGAWVYTGDWGPIVAFVQEAVLGTGESGDAPQPADSDSTGTTDPASSFSAPSVAIFDRRAVGILQAAR